MRLKKYFILEVISTLQDHGVLVFNGLGENYVNALQTLRYFVQKMISVFGNDQDALFLLKERRRLAAFRTHCQWRWRMALKGLIQKRGKSKKP